MCSRTPLSLVGARPRGRTRTEVGVSCSPAVSDGTCEAACACRVMRACHSSAITDSSANSEVVSCTDRSVGLGRHEARAASCVSGVTDDRRRLTRAELHRHGHLPLARSPRRERCGRQTTLHSETAPRPTLPCPAARQPLVASALNALEAERLTGRIFCGSSLRSWTLDSPTDY